MQFQAEKVVAEADQRDLESIMRESGMSLVELLVSLALLSVVFLAAGPLIVQSIRVFGAAGRSLMDPDAVVAGAWLRQDVHSAYSVGTGPDNRMMLLMPEGKHVSYEQSGSSLVRRVYSAKGEVLSRQKIVPKIIGWGWGYVGDCVYVNLYLPSHVEPGRVALIRDSKRMKTTGVRSERFCFSIRGQRRMSW